MHARMRTPNVKKQDKLPDSRFQLPPALRSHAVSTATSCGQATHQAARMTAQRQSVSRVSLQSGSEATSSWGYALRSAARMTALRHSVSRVSMQSGAEITMPALSSTMKEGKIVQWTKSVGDR